MIATRLTFWEIESNEATLFAWKYIFYWLNLCVFVKVEKVGHLWRHISVVFWRSSKRLLSYDHRKIVHDVHVFWIFRWINMIITLLFHTVNWVDLGRNRKFWRYNFSRHRPRPTSTYANLLKYTSGRLLYCHSQNYIFLTFVRF